MSITPLPGIHARGTNYRKRWLALREAPDFEIQKIPAYFAKTPKGLGDCRGFFFNLAAAGHRVTHEDLRFEGCDLSDCSFAHCNLMSPAFKDCWFEACDFTEIRMWNCRFTNCGFSQCAFTGQLGVEGRYTGCNFLRCTFNGKKGRSLFGHDAEHTNCTFVKCRIQTVDLKSTRFKDCRFESSTFSSVKFLGAHATSHLTGCSAVALEHCDLSQSVFKNVHVDADCGLVGTRLPPAG